MRVATITLLFVLALAAPAAAAIDLGSGRGAAVTVDTAGTAHILFRSPPAADAPATGATYCRLPRNAKACDVRTFLPIARAPIASKLLRRASDGVLVALQTDNEPRSDGGSGTLWVSYSADNGATFSAPAILAIGIGTAEPLALAPDSQSVFSADPDTGGMLLYRSPFAAPDPRALNVDDTANVASEAGGMVAMADGRMLVTQTTLGDTGWRLFAGGDPLDINAWPTRGKLKNVDADALATGPRGTYLLDGRGLSRQLVSGATPFSLRSFDTKRLRWRSGRGAMADQVIFGDSDLFQDPSGRLHLAATAGNGSAGECVLYSRTGTRSSRWFGRTTILFRSRTKAPHEVKTAAAPDGRGVAVWHDLRGSIRDEGNVWVTPLRQAKGRYRSLSRTNRLMCGRSR